MSPTSGTVVYDTDFMCLFNGNGFTWLTSTGEKIAMYGDNTTVTSGWSVSGGTYRNVGYDVWISKDSQTISTAFTPGNQGTVDVGGLQLIQNVTCSGTQVTNLIVSGCVLLSGIDANSCIYLPSLDLSGLSVFSTLQTWGCSSLTSLIPPSTIADGVYFDCHDGALDLTSVNAIIDACNILDPDPGTVNISGGSNATPSGPQITKIGLLIGAGWTITYNP
jgi:hypothetical protein